MALVVKKKKSFDAFCVCEFHVDCFHVAVIHVSASAVSTADALGSRAAGTSTSGAPSGYHQPLGPRSCLVFLTFFFHNYIFLPTLFLSPHHPFPNWLPQGTEGHLETFVILFEKIQLSPQLKKQFTSQPQLEGARTLLELWEGSGDGRPEASYQPLLRVVHLSFYCCRLVAKSCPAVCQPMGRSTPGLPVRHQLPEPTQTRVH